MVRALALVPLLVLLSGRFSLALQMPATPEVDSAAAARAAYARATSALRAGDTASARREVTRAAAAWPAQPAYVWARVVLAARRRDTATVIDALTRYADLGLGRALDADPAFAAFRSLPAFTALVTRHEEHRASVAHGKERATLPDSTFWPEGLDVDRRSGRLYVTSIRHRTIAELSPSGELLRELLPRHAPGIGAIMAVRVDPARGVAWATSAPLPQMAGYGAGDSIPAALLRIRLADGVVERRWILPPASAGHVPGDVALGPAGDVYVSDSREPVLYRLRPGTDSLEALRHPLFRSLQGIAPAADGRVVYVADYSHGLLRVEIGSGRVTRLPDAPYSTSLGCDGLAWHDGALIAVQNGVAPPRVMRFVLDPSGTRITRAEVLDRNVAVADEPTAGVVVGSDFVYVANSQWAQYDDSGALRAGAVLRRPVLMAVPLRR